MIVDSAGDMIHNQQDLVDLERLMIDAFERTRSTGRKNRNEMTVPVLKNRLLDLTQRQFSETSYGADSMSELVGLLPELLELDNSRKPPRVRLREGWVRSTPVPHTRYQIRRDLWNAVVDFGRGEPYVWSGALAVPARESKSAGELKVLPTLTREEEMGWRADFLASVAGQSNDSDRVRVDVWLDRQLSTKVLPGEMQGPWSDYLKARVLDRLRQWFRTNEIREPPDLLSTAAPRTEDRSDGSVLDELRALVIRYVQSMTMDELSELRLPARVFLSGRR
jgi:hypothetical protein